MADLASTPDNPPDSLRNVKRKLSRPTASEDAGENGHASSRDANGLRRDAAQSPPSAGAHTSPIDSSLSPDSEKPTDTTSTNASSANKGPRSKPRTSPRQKKPSFWTRFLHSLLPCLGSTKHSIDVDDASPLREKKPRSIDVDERASERKDKIHDISTSSGHTPEPSTSTPTPTPLAIPIQSAALPPPTPPSEPTVIIPPSPKTRLPREETEGLTSGAVQPPGSAGTEGPEPEERESDRSDSSSFTDDDEHERDVMSPGAGTGLPEDDIEDEEDRLLLSGGAGIPIGPDGIPRPLLPPVAAHHAGRKCLVLDLDETLVHSSFKLIPQADYVVPVEIEWQWHNVYVIKRPGVDNFLKQMGEIYEIVVFTASLSKYADPVLDKLDVHKVVSHRLFRESCYNHKGNYVKDLSQLGRPITDMIILDNSPASYIFHPNNAVPVSSWFNDPHDTELTDLCPFLADLGTVEDVRGVLDGGL